MLVIRREWGAVAAWTCAGFLLRYLLLPYRGEIETDGAFFGMLARQIAAGEASFGLMRPPFYGVLMAALAPFFANMEETGRWVSLVAGTFSLPLIYLLGRLAVSHTAGMVALVLAAFEPTMILYSTSVLSESSYLFFFLSALLLTAGLFRRRGALLAAAAGIVWGLAYLTRHEGAGFFFLTLGGVFALLARRKIPLSKTLFLALFLVVGFGAVTFPYLHYLKKTTGAWTLSDKGALQLYIGAASVGPGWEERWEKSILGLNAEGTEVVSQRFPVDREVRKKYRPQMREMLQTYAANAALFFKTWSAQWLPFGAVLFLGAGLLAFFGDPSLRSRGPWVLFWIFPAFFLPFFYFDVRYLYFLIPLCLLFAAAGAKAVAEKFSAGKPVLWGLVFFLSLSFLPSAISAARQSRGTGDLTKGAGRWIRENYPLGVRVMDRYPQIPFYAGAEQVSLPSDTAERILNFARLKRARLLVARRSVVAGLRPQLLFLFESADPRPGLKLVYQGRVSGPSGDDEVRIFEFL